MSTTLQAARPSALVQRSGAIAMLISLVGVIVLGVGSVVPKVMHSQEQWRNSAHKELGALRGWASSLVPIQRESRNLENDPLWQQLFAANRADVSDLIKRDVTSILSAVDATGAAVSPIANAGSGTGPLKSVGVRATATMNVEQLRAALSVIRLRVPYLRVQHLQVTAPQTQGTEVNPMLAVEMDVVGFMKVESALSGSAPR